MCQRYQKIQIAGSGTYGRVYYAKDLDTKQEVAIKRNFLAPGYEGTIGLVRELQFLMEFFINPYCIHLREIYFDNPFTEPLSPTPMIENSKNKLCYDSDPMILILDKGTCDGDKFINSSKTLVNERKLFLLHLLLATEFIHSRGAIHCDIKPSNIIVFLNKEGRFEKANLTDFGLSMYESSQVTCESTVVTQWYRAPEIALRLQYTNKIDVWSIGVTALELFSPTFQAFLQVQTDDELVKEIARKLPVTPEFKAFRQAIFRQVHKLTITSQPYTYLSYTKEHIAAFDAKQYHGRGNSGSFEEFKQLLDMMLEVDPDKRSSVTQVLNHSFFDGYRSIIDECRASCGVNEEGVWVTKPKATLQVYESKDQLRARAFVMLKRFLSSSESKKPEWFNTRIFLHMLDMLDRFLSLTNPVKAGDYRITVWLNTFLLLSIKYFRILNGNFHLTDAIFGDYDKKKVLVNIKHFERKLIREVFKGIIIRESYAEIINGEGALDGAEIHALVDYLASLPQGTYSIEQLVRNIRISKI